MRIVIETPRVEEHAHLDKRYHLLCFKGGATVSLMDNQNELLQQIQMAPDILCSLTLGGVITFREDRGLFELAMILFGMALGGLTMAMVLGVIGGGS